MVRLDVWTDPQNTTAWDYVAIIDAGPALRLNVFRYADKPSSGPVPVELCVAWPDSPKDAEPAGGHRLKKPIEFLAGVLPPEQLARTPVLMHASNATAADDAALVDACKYVQEHAGLAANCAGATLRLGTDEGLLSWAAANSTAANSTADAHDRSVAVLGVGPSGVRLVMPANTTEPGFELGLGGSVASLHVATREIGDAERAACASDRAQARADSDNIEAACNAAVIAFLQPVLDSLTPFEPVAVYTERGFADYAAILESPSSGSKSGDARKTRAEASAHGSELLETTLTRQVLLSLSERSNVTLKGLAGSAELPADWTLGRALLYADAELASGDEAVGIRTGAGGDGNDDWRFGRGATLARPAVSARGDWMDRLNARSHRLWGALVLLTGLVAVIYLLLGKAGRGRIWTALSRSARPRAWKKVPTDENYELDDVALGEDADEEFEV